jgi:hypothetical protein
MLDHLESDQPLQMADGPSTWVGTDIAASPVAIWALVTDLNTPAAFSAEFQGGEWLDDAVGPVVGARFVGHNRHDAIGEWSTTSTVTRCEPGRAFAWEVGGGGGAAASWGFTIEHLAPGTDGVPRSRLVQWVRLGPGESGLTPALRANPDKEDKILRRRLAEHRGNMAATIDGIRRLAEGTR